MLVMVVFFIAFRWIHLSTPLIRLFLLVLILLLMPTLNFLPVWFVLILLRFLLLFRLLFMFIFLCFFFLFFFSAYLFFLAVCVRFSLLPFPIPLRLPMIFILWMVAMMVVIIPSRTV